MAKRFDPFADEDDLEFKLETSNPGKSPAADAEPANPATVPTRILPSPEPKRSRPLRLGFEELADEGGDVAGARAIGAETLESDEFLQGIQRRDHDEALQRALGAQRTAPSVKADEGRTIQNTPTSVYVLAVGAVLAILGLAAGGVALARHLEQADRARLAPPLSAPSNP